VRDNGDPDKRSKQCRPGSARGDCHKKHGTYDVDLLAEPAQPYRARHRGYAWDRAGHRRALPGGGRPGGNGRPGSSRRSSPGGGVPAVRSRRRFSTARARRCDRERGWSAGHPCQQCGHLAGHSGARSGPGGLESGDRRQPDRAGAISNTCRSRLGGPGKGRVRFLAATEPGLHGAVPHVDRAEWALPCDNGPCSLHS
jgi:hypothetical protein